MLFTLQEILEARYHHIPRWYVWLDRVCCDIGLLNSHDLQATDLPQRYEVLTQGQTDLPILYSSCFQEFDYLLGYSIIQFPAT